MTDPEVERQRTAVVSLDLPPAPVAIAIGRSVVRRIVTFKDSDAESSFLVAFTEILANAVDEHERLALDETIGVEVVQGPVEAVLVTDSGSGISSAEAERPPRPTVEHDATSEATVERGRGLALARAFIDGIEFETSDAGTVVTLPLRGMGIVR